MSYHMDIGTQVPDFTFDSIAGPEQQFAQFKGSNIVLYFYPRDLTPGCTSESEDFRDFIKAFEKLNTVVLGISRDTLKSHQKFIDKLDLPFDLISDPDEKLCQLFDVMRNKNMYGKQVRGIERSTFLIDSKGIIQKTWRKVKVNGHVEEVLAAVKEINAG